MLGPALGPGYVAVNKMETGLVPWNDAFVFTCCEKSGTRRTYKWTGLCVGVRAGDPEEVTLTLGSEAQTWS